MVQKKISWKYSKDHLFRGLMVNPRPINGLLHALVAEPKD